MESDLRDCCEFVFGDAIVGIGERSYIKASVDCLVKSQKISFDDEPDAPISDVVDQKLVWSDL